MLVPLLLLLGGIVIGVVGMACLVLWWTRDFDPWA